MICSRVLSGYMEGGEPTVATQRLFESDENFRLRAKREALEKSSGLSQGIFESDEAYEKRASQATLEKTSGITQRIFESDEAYQKRATKIALEKASACSQGIFEPDKIFEDRALEEAIERTSGTPKRLFESKRSYQDRAARELADDPYGKRGYVYLLQERKRTDADERLKQSDMHITSKPGHAASTQSSKTKSILKGIGIGLLVDIGLFVITLGGHLLEALLGIQNYGFLFDLPPIIGGIVGALCSAND